MSHIWGLGSSSVGRAGLEPVSGAAPVEARTDDRDASEDRRVLGFDQLRQFIVASVLEGVDRDGGAPRRPALPPAPGARTRPSPTRLLPIADFPRCRSSEFPK